MRVLVSCLVLLLWCACAWVCDAGQQPQSRADMEFKSWPREDPGHLDGYCPTRGSRARAWQDGDLDGCTMLDLYSQGLNATTMTELSIILALHGRSANS